MDIPMKTIPVMIISAYIGAAIGWLFGFVSGRQWQKNKAQKVVLENLEKLRYIQSVTNENGSAALFHWQVFDMKVSSKKK